ncbi:hypothetical protein [Polaromonas glacialis]|uniref:hypothetical protein n=1 Tax=Polaromonas glacialis TaxID=866564 RepID=UPI0012EBA612|nr:hypothetical protein [Polaromonas glacialis]
MSSTEFSGVRVASNLQKTLFGAGEALSANQFDCTLLRMPAMLAGLGSSKLVSCEPVLKDL